MRLMKKSTLSYFLKALDFFTDSGGLPPNSTAFVKPLLTGQLPSEKLRLSSGYQDMMIPYEGNSHSSEESEDSTPFDPADDAQS
jgi:hypothetical protein